jgi:phenylacetate-CoA ligase
MTDIYAATFRHVLFPAWEGLVRRRPTLSLLRQLERSQWCSLDELCALQSDALVRLVKHAHAHVPYYAHRLRAHGVGPEDVRSHQDIVKLPILARDEARESFEQRKSTAPPLFELAKSTSGTSGNPLRFGYDRGSEHWRTAVKLRGYGWAGYRPGDRVLHFWGVLSTFYSRSWRQRIKQDADHFLKREYFIDSTDRSEDNLGRVVSAIRKLRPRVIVCYAQAGAALARYVNEHGLRDWQTIRVITGAERLFPADRLALEQAFGPAVFESYGSREVMLMGMDCEAHRGLHVPMENVLLEVLVREDSGLRPARPGELGEIAVTDLHNYGMPFIRYLTGDTGVFEPTSACSCGRALPRLRSIDGRVTETLRDAAGRAVSGLFFNVLFSVLADKVRGFQAVQRKDGSVDLKLVPNHAFDDGVLQLLDANCKKFLKGVDVRTELVTVIPAGKNGKLQVVVVER